MTAGDIRLGDTIDVQFGTSVNGVPTTLVGGTIGAYVGNNTTELTAGITLSTDFDTRTGLHNVRVVATSGNGYAAGSDINLVLTAGTVGGSSVANTPVGAFSIEKRSALMPTTAGRTLDVSAGGEAGLDWANIGSPTTAQNLSATNIDVDQIVASVSGAVGSVTGAVGSVTGNVGGNVTGSVGSVVGAVGSVTGLTPATVHSDLDDIQTRLPAALVGGRMDSSVGAMAAGVLTATAIAADAITDAKVAADVTIASVTGAVGSVTGNVGGNVVGSVGSVTAGVTLANDAITAAKFDETTAFPLKSDDSGSTQVARTGADGDTLETLSDQIDGVSTATAAGIADAVWEEAIADHSGTVGSTAEALAAAASAGDPWATSLPGAYGAGTAGKIVGDNLNATVSSRATQTSVDDIPTNAELATALAAADDATLAAIAALNDLSAADAADAVWEEAIADHSGTVGSTAEALAAAGAAGDPWITALPGAYGAGTAGKIVGDNINATISSRATQASVDTIDGIVDSILIDTTEIGVAGAGLTNIDLPNQTMNITGNITGNLTGSVGSVTAGVTLAAGAVQAIWDALTAALTTAGSIGKLLVDNINATISSRLASASYTTPPTVGAIADQVWDEAIAGHAIAGSTGAALSSAAAGGSAPTAVEIADEVETRALTLTVSERNSIANALLDLANSIETGVTLRQAQRLELAALAGKISGAGGTTVTIRNAVADSKDRIVATVDVNGDRTAITTDMS